MLKNTGDDNDGSEDDRKKGRKGSEKRVKMSTHHCFHAWARGVSCSDSHLAPGQDPGAGSRRWRVEQASGAKGLVEFFTKRLVFLVTMLPTAEFLDTQGISSSQLISIELCGNI